MRRAIQRGLACTQRSTPAGAADGALRAQIGPWAAMETLQSGRMFASEAKSAGAGGPVSFASLGLMLATGTGLYYAYKTMKNAKVQQATDQQTVSVGKAKVGGPFSLKNQDGKRFTDKDLHGEFSLLYFGFCTCPDICPDELEKLSAAIDAVEKKTGAQIQPVFISVDPERDTVKRVKSYVKEFHPRLIGLTGTKQEVDAAAKAYRVYYMKTDDSKDYLIDHSIIMYLLDPNGNFVTFFGKNFTEEQLGDKMAKIVTDWAASNPDYKLPAAAASAKAA